MVADFACGSGVGLVTMAKAFPKSTFYGWDISNIALDRGRENALTAGVSNVTFFNVHERSFPGDSRFDFVTTFDCVHDLTSPETTVKAIDEALSRTAPG